MADDPAASDILSGWYHEPFIRLPPRTPLLCGEFLFRVIAGVAIFAAALMAPAAGTQQESSVFSFQVRDGGRSAVVRTRLTIAGPELATAPNNTFPFRQSTDSGCTFNAVRNLEWMLTGGRLARSEMEIGQIMTAAARRAGLLRNSGAAESASRYLAAVNAALEPIGYRIGPGVEYTGSIQFRTLMSEAANNGTLFIAQTYMHSGIGVRPVLNAIMPANHSLVLSPFWQANPYGDPPLLRIAVIDSGVPSATNGGNARVSILSIDEAVFVPNHVVSVLGVQSSNLNPILPIVPSRQVTPRTAPHP